MAQAYERFKITYTGNGRTHERVCMFREDAEDVAAHYAAKGMTATIAPFMREHDEECDCDLCRKARA